VLFREIFYSCPIRQEEAESAMVSLVRTGDELAVAAKLGRDEYVGITTVSSSRHEHCLVAWVGALIFRREPSSHVLLKISVMIYAAAGYACWKAAFWLSGSWFRS